MITGGAFLVGLIALLAGLAIGKAWERYKLKDGVWIDRRRARESPHYMLGLNFLVANQIDQAIDELSQAAQAAGDPLEIHLILGNLYREKGQVGRAIQEHQALLRRPDLRPRVVVGQLRQAPPRVVRLGPLMLFLVELL